MNVRTLIIDDERKAIEILRNKLETLFPQVEIVGTTQSPEDGLLMIKNLEPQLVFLDIAMPQMSGFDLLAKVENPNFEIIFATAFDNFALAAIKHCAIGYLVKPIDNKDLLAAVTHAYDNIEKKNALEKNQVLLDNLSQQSKHKRKVAIPVEDGLEFVNVCDIIHCEGVKGYTKIYLSNNLHLLSSYSIGHYCDLLGEQTFYQVHKSHLINIDCIKKYTNEGFVLLANKREVPVSRNRRSDFLDILKNA